MPPSDKALPPQARVESHEVSTEPLQQAKSASDAPEPRGAGQIFDHKTGRFTKVSILARDSSATAGSDAVEGSAAAVATSNEKPKPSPRPSPRAPAAATPHTSPPVVTGAGKPASPPAEVTMHPPTIVAPVPRRPPPVAAVQATASDDSKGVERLPVQKPAAQPTHAAHNGKSREPAPRDNLQEGEKKQVIFTARAAERLRRPPRTNGILYRHGATTSEFICADVPAGAPDPLVIMWERSKQIVAEEERRARATAALALSAVRMKEQRVKTLQQEQQTKAKIDSEAASTPPQPEPLDREKLREERRQRKKGNKAVEEAGTAAVIPAASAPLPSGTVIVHHQPGVLSAFDFEEFEIVKGRRTKLKEHKKQKEDEEKMAADKRAEEEAVALKKARQAQAEAHQTRKREIAAAFKASRAKADAERKRQAQAARKAAEKAPQVEEEATKRETPSASKPIAVDDLSQAIPEAKPSPLRVSVSPVLGATSGHPSIDFQPKISFGTLMLSSSPGVESFSDDGKRKEMNISSSLQESAEETQHGLLNSPSLAGSTVVVPSSAASQAWPAVSSAAVSAPRSFSSSGKVTPVGWGGGAQSQQAAGGPTGVQQGLSLSTTDWAAAGSVPRGGTSAPSPIWSDNLPSGGGAGSSSGHTAVGAGGAAAFGPFSMNGSTWSAPLGSAPGKEYHDTLGPNALSSSTPWAPDEDQAEPLEKSAIGLNTAADTFVPRSRQSVPQSTEQASLGESAELPLATDGGEAAVGDGVDAMIGVNPPFEGQQRAGRGSGRQYIKGGRGPRHKRRNSNDSSGGGHISGENLSSGGDPRATDARPTRINNKRFGLKPRMPKPANEGTADDVSAGGNRARGGRGFVKRRGDAVSTGAPVENLNNPPPYRGGYSGRGRGGRGRGGRNFHARLPEHSQQKEEKSGA